MVSFSESSASCASLQRQALALPKRKTKASPATADKAAIEALEERYIKAFNAKDVNAIMENYAPGDQLFVFDAVPPREYAGWDAYKKDWESLFAAFPGPVSNAMSDRNVTVVGTVAYAHHIESGHFTRKDGCRLEVAARATDVIPQDQREMAYCARACFHFLLDSSIEI
jgi:ketosteroid isomerase-like protein